MDALEVIEGVKVVRGKLTIGGAKCFKLMSARNTVYLSKVDAATRRSSSHFLKETIC